MFYFRCKRRQRAMPDRTPPEQSRYDAPNLTVVDVVVDIVVGDREVVRVVVRVEAVLVVVVHLVVGPHSPLVAVRVVAVVVVVDVAVLDVAVHVGGGEHVVVGQVLAEPADLPGEAVRLRGEVAQVARFRVDEVLNTTRSQASPKCEEKKLNIRQPTRSCFRNEGQGKSTTI